MSLGESATEDDGRLIASLFGAVGKVWKADEKSFDAVTGLRYVSWVRMGVGQNVLLICQ